MHRPDGELERLISCMERDFARHLTKSRYAGKYLAINLTTIFRSWAANSTASTAYNLLNGS
jgi:hypothetical protein